MEQLTYQEICNRLDHSFNNLLMSKRSIVLHWGTVTVQTPLDILFVSGPPLPQSKQLVPHEVDCGVERINATMCVCKCIYEPVCASVSASLYGYVWVCIHNWKAMSEKKNVLEKKIKAFTSNHVKVAHRHCTQSRNPQQNSLSNTHCDHCHQSYRRLLLTNSNGPTGMRDAVRKTVLLNIN